MSNLNEIQTNKYFDTSQQQQQQHQQTNLKKLEGKINNGFESYLKQANRDTAHIAGLYDFEGTIGQGHFAVVKLARHLFSGEKVAIKVIDKLKLDELSREHLFQEVKCMKLVQHPNVVRLYEVIDTESKLYLILELGDGGDMYDYIMKHSNGLSEHKSRVYFRQIVNAVKYCHDLHVVHRDLKPENVVFFERTGQVKLTDFGFSNIFVPGNKLYTSCGSLAYSAPEILLGDSYDAPAVDVWSLGVILYMLATGRAPFQEANDSETLTMILDCKYYLPAHVSPECNDLISRILVRDPERRIKLDDILNHPFLRDLTGEEQLTNGYSSDCSYSDRLTGECCDEKEDDYGENDADNDDDNEELFEKNKRSSQNKENQHSSKRKKQKNADKFLNKNSWLIKRENLSEQEHNYIVEQMLHGKVANTRDEILKALDEDKYNYLTATYYLLAEKILKKQFMKRKKSKFGFNSQENSLKPPMLTNNNNNTNTDLSTSNTVTTNDLFMYQTKPLVKSLPAKTNYAKQLRNKLVRQDEAENEHEEEENDRAALIKEDNLSPQKAEEIVIVSQTQLTNILEDEEEVPDDEDVLFKNETSNFTLVNNGANPTIMSMSRRSSRGGENTNVISNLTILEEVEAEHFSGDSFNNSTNNKVTNNKVKLYSRNSSESLTRYANDDKVNDYISEESDYRKLDFETRCNGNDAINTSEISSKNKIKMFASKLPSSGADTSSDASDNELKAMSFSQREIKDYDWNRSSSSRSRSKSARQTANLSVLNGSQQYSRPLSISSETNKEDTVSLKNEVQNSFNLRTKSLAEEGNFNAQSSLGYLNQNKQFLSVSNSNDHLSNSNFALLGKSLSVEHRMANISQMSISSQLSKNNSLRFPTRSGACDTPVQHVQPSATPTPRESIVFNRGDEKPIAKILLGQSQHQLRSQNSAEFAHILNQLSAQHNSISSVGSSPRSSIKSESKPTILVKQESNPTFALNSFSETLNETNTLSAASTTTTTTNKIAQTKEVPSFLLETINSKLKHLGQEDKESQKSSSHKSLDSICSLSQETLTNNSNKSAVNCQTNRTSETNLKRATPDCVKSSEITHDTNALVNGLESRTKPNSKEKQKLNMSSTINLSEEKVKKDGLYMTNTCTKCCNIL